MTKKKNIVYESDTTETPKLDQKYLELHTHNIGVKLTSWILICCKRIVTQPSQERNDLKLLVKNICNAVDHSAGEYILCKEIDPNGTCI